MNWREKWRLRRKRKKEKQRQKEEVKKSHAEYSEIQEESLESKEMTTAANTPVRRKNVGLSRKEKKGRSCALI